MQNPLLDAILPLGFEGNDLINYLKIKYEQDLELFEIRKSTLSELEKSQEEKNLAKIENHIVELALKQLQEKIRHDIGHPVATREKGDINEFMSWERKPTIDALTFLLTEFFSNSFRDKEWSKDFIAELVFEIGRLIEFLNNHPDQ